MSFCPSHVFLPEDLSTDAEGSVFIHVPGRQLRTQWFDWEHMQPLELLGDPPRFSKRARYASLVSETEMDDELIFSRRDWLATVSGVLTHKATGSNVEGAPCNMLLGNAIHHLAGLETLKCDEHEASVALAGIVLNCKDCRRLAAKFGEALRVAE